MFTFIIIATIIISFAAYSKWVDKKMEEALENRDALAQDLLKEDARLEARRHLRGE